MPAPVPVLVSWIAVNNDPYERDRTGEFIRINGQPAPGPTLTVLTDAESPYAGKVKDFVLLHRKGDGRDDAKERRAVSETVDALKERDASVCIHHEEWDGADPTDHTGIFEFLRERLPKIRRRFVGAELVLHISPGTPSMQTIWVLMAETGYVEPPFRVVKSYRPNERRGRPAVVPVEVGIETFYKVYQQSHPRQVSSEDQAVRWDPEKFRTDRMRSLFAEARRFAQVKVPVLILGERGTGKSTLAGWMRLHSPYRKPDLDRRWPAVACGQYTSETMRSELFGHTKGAFTGAATDKKGLLVDAHGDTLFLDEIGDVSRDLQRLLIKAVEEKRFFPLGAKAPIDSDFRLISATNLEGDELARRLDPDFRDRVNSLTLRLPALREIRDELQWLWDSAFQTATERAGVSRRSAQFDDTHHQRVIKRLREHPLPGNMRDLFRVAYRIVAARGDVHAPLSPADAVEYGLLALSDGITPATESTSRAVARSFADATPLDQLVAKVGLISTKDLNRDLRAYVAAELRRIAKTSARPVDEICDVTDRSLRTWATARADGTELPSEGRPAPNSDGEPG
jgi:DNA-binding NtrC family response regulator